MKDNQIVTIENNIQNKIYTIRDKQVMIDSDLAKLYGVETKHINQAVRNNPDKFPNDFYFELTYEELEILKSKFSTSSWGGRRKPAKAFTEQGVYMLATILKSKTATDVTVAIMRAFVKLREFSLTYGEILDKLAIIGLGYLGLPLVYAIENNNLEVIGKK